MPVPLALLSRARQVAAEYRGEHGTPKTAGQLAVRLQAVARAARPDFDAWLRHVKPAAGCTSPIRLAESI
jgi:hypothetical protein